MEVVAIYLASSMIFGEDSTSAVAEAEANMVHSKRMRETGFWSNCFDDLTIAAEGSDQQQSSNLAHAQPL